MNNKQSGHHSSKLISWATFVLILIIGLNNQSFAQKKLKPSDWKIGIQAWTFHYFTFEEALNKIDSCGVKYVEGFPNQEIGNGIEGKMDYHMSADKRKEVKKMLRKHGIKMVSYGVVSPKTEADWEQLFKFAKAMGLENIASEPKEEQIPLVSKLADKYKINVAIHDHPKPSHYWNPDILLNAIKGASPRIGSCADVGHWQRSGLDPVECMKKLQGHIKEFHMKDLNEKGVRSAHDVPWGTGINNIAGIMQEMKRQHFKGFVFVEYEYNWKNSVPEVKKSVEFFRQEKQKLLK